MSKIATNAHQLWEETGCSEDNIKKWHLDAQKVLPNGKPDYTDKKASLKLIAAHRRGPMKDTQKQRAIDPVSGLTWHEAKLREATIAQRLSNQEKATKLSKEWVTAERHFALLKGLCSKIDQCPAKAKSQLNLTEEQRIELQKILDDARLEFTGSAEHELLSVD